MSNVMITNTDLNRYYADNVQMSRGNTKKSISIVMPVINDVLKKINRQDPRFSGQPLCTGSYYQGLKVDRADEFDINVPILGVDVDEMEWGDYPDLYFKVIDGAIRRTDVPHPPPPTGYCNVDFDNPSFPIWRDNDMRFDDVLVPFLVRKHFKELFKQARDESGHQDVINMSNWRHGPALTFSVEVEGHHPISVDFAPLLEMPRSTLPTNVQWPHKGAQWPSKEKKQTLKHMGVNFVAKKDMFWYISFGHMEKELLHKIDEDGGCRKRLQRIMKRMRDEIWCQGNKPVLSSYHLKNLLFWECEDHPWSHEWTQDSQAERFDSMVKRLRDALVNRRLPQFFQPEVNLLRSDDEAHQWKLDDVIRKIDAFLRNPARYFS